MPEHPLVKMGERVRNLIEKSPKGKVLSQLHGGAEPARVRLYLSILDRREKQRGLTPAEWKARAKVLGVWDRKGKKRPPPPVRYPTKEEIRRERSQRAGESELKKKMT